MGIKEGEEPSPEKQAELLQRATEASIKQQVDKVAASKIIQANWAGEKSAFPGEPSKRVKVHG